ncbi:MAG TPA: hypothetical protein VF723_02610 [Pyrinomonadaceae bacterium]
MLISLVGIVLVVPFFAIALIVGTRAVELSHSAQDDLLLIALMLGGAAASIINGFGRRTGGEKLAAGSRAEREGAGSASGRASMINLGY